MSYHIHTKLSPDREDDNFLKLLACTSKTNGKPNYIWFNVIHRLNTSYKYICDEMILLSFLLLSVFLKYV